MTSLTLVRRIRARPSIVFDALTMPEGIACWWGPDGGPVLLAGGRRGRVQPGQRHGLRVIVGKVDGRDLLDGELDSGQLRLPPRLELRHGIEHQVVEALGTAAVQRNVLRGECAAQAAAPGVPPPDPRRPRPVTAIIHSH